jgi:hypothetical protein
VSALLAAAAQDDAGDAWKLIGALLLAVAAIAVFTGGSNRNGR